MSATSRGDRWDSEEGPPPTAGEEEEEKEAEEKEEKEEQKTTMREDSEGAVAREERWHMDDERGSLCSRMQRGGASTNR